MNNDISDIITIMMELNDTVNSFENNKKEINEMKESIDDLKKDFETKMDSFKKNITPLKQEVIPVDNSQDNENKT